MAQVKTHRQLRAEYIVKMGREPGIAVHVLYNELLRLRMNWEEYVQLFGTSEKRIDLLNQASPRFFRMLEDELFESALLHLCRMTDRPVIAGHRTTTIQMLPAMFPTLARRLNPRVKKALTKTKFARDWRNRRISHHNFDRELKPRQLNKASRAKVIAAIEAIHDVLALIHLKYFNYEPLREPPDSRWEGAATLLLIIRGGLLRRQERKDAYVRGDLHWKDFHKERDDLDD